MRSRCLLPHGIWTWSASRPCTATTPWRTPRATLWRSSSWRVSMCRWRLAAPIRWRNGGRRLPRCTARAVSTAADLPEPKRRPVGAHAVDFIIDMAARHRGELVLATIGPETNVALALRREPRLKDWLREITVMGGSTGSGNVTTAAEFNIHCDPEAAWVVFNSGVPIRMVGLNVTRRTGFDRADIARMKASGRKVASVIADLMAFYLARQRERHGLDVAPMHDVCAIVPYVDATLIEYLRTRVDIELGGAHTRGMTVCDLRPARLSVVQDGRANSERPGRHRCEEPSVDRAGDWDCLVLRLRPSPTFSGPLTAEEPCSDRGFPHGLARA